MNTTKRAFKQSKSRQMLHLPNKMMFISTFFNQKLKSQLHSTQTHFAPNLPQSPLIKKQKNLSIQSAPKYELNNNKIFLAFDETNVGNKKYRKVSRHISLYKDQKRMNDNNILRRIAMVMKQRIASTKDNHENFIINSKKSALLGQEHHQIIKQQLQDKFQKTRLHFKQKMKEDLVKQISKTTRKNYLLNKINHSEDITQRFNEAEKFQPWPKDKFNKNDYYQIEDNAENQVEF